MKNSRHTIAEAGFETILANLQKSKAEADTGKTDGPAWSTRASRRLRASTGRAIISSDDTPRGEIWNVYLDPRSMLPRLVVAENDRGDLLERYVYSEIRENPTELASADAFIPAERWGEGKGSILSACQGSFGLQCAKQ